MARAKIVEKLLISSAVFLYISQNFASAKDENSEYSSNDQEQDDEIVVTALKTKQRLIDVPVAVTAINAHDLTKQNLVTLKDYYSRIPGLAIGGQTTSDISLRGVTSGGATNPTVGIVVDDIQYGSSTSNGVGNGRFPDFDPSMLERIEVLRGPQGTLYGASTLGGLIKFVTRTPDTQSFSGRLEGGVTVVKGGNAGYLGRGAVNLPIVTEKMALSVSGFYRTEPRYIDIVSRTDPGTVAATNVNKDRVWGGQAALLIKPTDTLSVTLSAMRQDRSSAYGTGVNVGVAADGTPDYIPQYGRNRILARASTRTELAQLYSGRISVELGPVNLDSVTAYQKNDAALNADLSNVFFFVPSFYNQAPGSVVYLGDKTASDRFSQEVRLSGSSPLLSWIVGGIYARETSTNFQSLDLVSASGDHVATPYVGSTPFRYVETAGFVNLTFHFTEQFELQLGGRYAHNNQLAENKLVIDAPVVPVFGPSGALPIGKSKEDVFTFAVSPSYHINPDLMVYARVATGYRPGGANTPLSGIPLLFGSDRVTNYELGLKGNVAKGVQIDASLFQIDWKDIQLQNTDTDSQISFYTNGGRARSKGAELSITTRPFAGTSVGGNIALVDAKLTEDLVAPPNSSTPLIGLKGNRLPTSAKFSSNVYVNQHLDLGERLGADFSVNWSYVGKREALFLAQGATLPRFEVPGYHKVDANVGFTYDRVWQLNLFVRNLLDARGVLFADNRNGTLSPPSASFITPRTVGFTAARQF